MIAVKDLNRPLQKMSNAVAEGDGVMLFAREDVTARVDTDAGDLDAVAVLFI